MPSLAVPSAVNCTFTARQVTILFNSKCVPPPLFSLQVKCCLSAEFLTVTTRNVAASSVNASQFCTTSKFPKTENLPHSKYISNVCCAGTPSVCYNLPSLPKQHLLNSDKTHQELKHLNNVSVRRPYFSLKEGKIQANSNIYCAASSSFSFLSS